MTDALYPLLKIFFIIVHHCSAMWHSEVEYTFHESQALTATQRSSWTCPHGPSRPYLPLPYPAFTSHSPRRELEKDMCPSLDYLHAINNYCIQCIIIWLIDLWLQCHLSTLERHHRWKTLMEYVKISNFNQQR